MERNNWFWFLGFLVNCNDNLTDHFDVFKSFVVQFQCSIHGVHSEECASIPISQRDSPHNCCHCKLHSWRTCHCSQEGMYFCIVINNGSGYSICQNQVVFPDIFFYSWFLTPRIKHKFLYTATGCELVLQSCWDIGFWHDPTMQAYADGLVHFSDGMSMSWWFYKPK